MKKRGREESSREGTPDANSHSTSIEISEDNGWHSSPDQVPRNLKRPKILPLDRNIAGFDDSAISPIFGSQFRLIPDEFSLTESALSLQEGSLSNAFGSAMKIGAALDQKQQSESMIGNPSVQISPTCSDKNPSPRFQLTKSSIEKLAGENTAKGSKKEI